MSNIYYINGRSHSALFVIPEGNLLLHLSVGHQSGCPTRLTSPSEPKRNKVGIDLERESPSRNGNPPMAKSESWVGHPAPGGCYVP